MKNLTNCDPYEFVAQTAKIRKAVKKWLEMTKIIDIMREKPTEGATDAELERGIRSKIDAVLDACLEDHPKETAELLGLMCFIEPNNLKAYKMRDLLASATEMINDSEVMGFFISLVRLATTPI